MFPPSSCGHTVFTHPAQSVLSGVTLRWSLSEGWTYWHTQAAGRELEHAGFRTIEAQDGSCAAVPVDTIDPTCSVQYNSIIAFYKDF